MANLAGFDAATVDPQQTFDAIPAGKYVAAITDSEMKQTKAGTGSYLELVFEVLEGEHRGRKVWARLNLDNPNETTVQIAKAELSSICRAAGVLTPKDSAELHDIPMVITVKQKVREDNGEPANEVRGFAKRDSANGKPQQAQDNTPPWLRR